MQSLLARRFVDEVLLIAAVQQSQHTSRKKKHADPCGQRHPQPAP